MNLLSKLKSVFYNKHLMHPSVISELLHNYNLRFGMINVFKRENLDKHFEMSWWFHRMENQKKRMKRDGIKSMVQMRMNGNSFSSMDETWIRNGISSEYVNEFHFNISAHWEYFMRKIRSDFEVCI